MKTAKKTAVPATAFERFLRKAGVRVEELDTAKSNQGKSIRIGSLLSGLLGQSVQINVKGRTGKAVLRSESLRSGKTGYYFEIEWDPETPTENPSNANVTTTAAGPPSEIGPAGEMKTTADGAGAAVTNSPSGTPATTTAHAPATIVTSADTATETPSSHAGGNSESW